MNDQGNTETDLVSLVDDAHTCEERRLDPGVYASTRRGHALLVGINQRGLTVVDLGGVVRVGGIDVSDPDHLAAFADHLSLLAERFRDRQRPSTAPALVDHVATPGLYERTDTP